MEGTIREHENTRGWENTTIAQENSGIVFIVTDTGARSTSAIHRTEGRRGFPRHKK